mmetsp:Transcript_59680/g.132905  ORF Transcript_59680/g.132905 Transcript_59680/m.132905 type:complete len:255 (-) Transcript_59680:898-1662(-)
MALERAPSSRLMRTACVSRSAMKRPRSCFATVNSCFSLSLCNWTSFRFTRSAAFSFLCLRKLAKLMTRCTRFILCRMTGWMTSMSTAPISRAIASPFVSSLSFPLAALASAAIFSSLRAFSSSCFSSASACSISRSSCCKASCALFASASKSSLVFSTASMGTRVVSAVGPATIAAEEAASTWSTCWWGLVTLSNSVLSASRLPRKSFTHLRKPCRKTKMARKASFRSTVRALSSLFNLSSAGALRKILVLPIL